MVDKNFIAYFKILNLAHTDRKDNGLIRLNVYWKNIV